MIDRVKMNDSMVHFALPTLLLLPVLLAAEGTLHKAFGDRVLAELQDRDLITDKDVTQIVSQKHTGFNVLVPP